MDEYFSIKDLQVNYKTFEGEKKVLDIKELDIRKGETFGIVGESGSGKTVLALTILKLLATPPGIIGSGSIMFNGEDLLKKSESQMRKVRGRKIAMIFQDPMSTLNPVFTVGEQIIRVIRQNKEVSRKEAEREALRMVELVKLPDAGNLMKKYPHELSGGQRQRIIIATALSCGAEFLIADEPTRNLDVTIQAGILKLIAELQKELKITVLYIANNLGLVSVICDRVAILNRGEIIEMGTAREVLRNPLHPYTNMFLNAIPKSKNDRVDLSKLALSSREQVGEQSCGSFSKCLHRSESCREAAPVLRCVNGTHFVACHESFKGGA